VDYRQVDLTPENTPDLDGIEKAVQDSKIRAVLIQRSRGYATRASLSVGEIAEIIRRIRGVNDRVLILVDNCYGEFVERTEPIEAGADLVMGSLIKNPGGGLAPNGGYVAGRHSLVEATAQRLTVAGIGRKCGATLGYNRELYQGLFMAPHTVQQALKTAVFAAKMVELLGFTTDPASHAPRHDIVQMIHLESPERVQRFCAGIQAGAPVDSFVTPIPWDMPGYGCPVVMAAGSFIQGASIELTADAPMRPPYTVYMQGGLTYESGKTGIMLAIDKLLAGESGPKG
jgi:cystathionine beta-lyase family protein involved in aluminum resistance